MNFPSDHVSQETDWTNWTPTPEAVNALPLRLRRYILDLEACGASGLVQDVAALSEVNGALSLRLAECRCLPASDVAFVPLGLLPICAGPEATAALQHLRDLGWRTSEAAAVKVQRSAEELRWPMPPATWPSFSAVDVMGEPTRPGAPQALALLIFVEVVGTYAPSADGCATLAVNCNDLFVWGSADCEPLPPIGFDDGSEAVFWELYDLVRQLGVHGAEVWCCRRRGFRPQAPIEARWREEGRWTEELEALRAPGRS